MDASVEQLKRREEEEGAIGERGVCVYRKEKKRRGGREKERACVCVEKRKRSL